MRPLLRSLITAALISAAGAAASASAAVSATDDARHVVTLSAPARRIVSLAPHATELLYAAGAGDKLVGVSEYSDYPPSARKLPVVGNAMRLDLERIIAAKPDLVVTWSSGIPAAQVDKLRRLGIAVYDCDPRSFDAIASSMERLAALTGTQAAGHAEAERFRRRQADIAARFQDRAPVRVFYEIWRQPLMTLNGTHMVSTAIRLCGGRNVFDTLPQIAPTVGIEAVLQADPQAIVTGADNADRLWEQWQPFPSLAAVTHRNLFAIKSDLMTRAGPRILDGTEQLCKDLDIARIRLIKAAAHP